MKIPAFCGSRLALDKTIDALFQNIPYKCYRVLLNYREPIQDKFDKQ